MTGYQEALTDPSYAGQTLCFSYPLIGNYGISKNSFESKKVHCSAVVVKQACEQPQHSQSEKSFSSFLQENNVPGIAGVDTRKIVLSVRKAGVMGCALQEVGENNTKEIAQQLCLQAGKFDYTEKDYVLETGTKENYVVNDGGSETVVLLDYGAKSSIASELVANGFRVVVMNPLSTSQEVLLQKPIGVVASNGPGDPSKLPYAVQCLQGLLGKIPIFGVCLGHQLLCQALGAKTFKLKFGHRGANQPVKELGSNRCFITSQNHGYAVEQLPSGVEEWFTNLNDGTNEGIICEEKNCRSVQFHPEANPGPYDTKFLFKEFKKML